jgi:acetate kinase
VVFSGGVGENSAQIRTMVIEPLGHIGLSVEETRNAIFGGGARRISPEGSPASVLVIPTNEELEIARQTLAELEA